MFRGSLPNEFPLAGASDEEIKMCEIVHNRNARKLLYKSQGHKFIEQPETVMFNKIFLNAFRMHKL